MIRHATATPLFTCITMACFAAAVAPPVSAQPECEPRWTQGIAWQPGTVGDLFAVAAYDDGEGEAIYVAGTFTVATDPPALNVARWIDGSWKALGAGINGGVTALAVYHDELIAAGEFTSAGGVAVNNIARWDGYTWRPLGSGITGSSSFNIEAMTVYNDELIVVGDHFRVSTPTGNTWNIGRWNGSEWLSTGAFSSSGSVWYNNVDSATVHADELIVGGSFIQIGGVSANYVARWNGTNWSTLADGFNGATGSTPHVDALASYNGSLFAGGHFHNAGATSVNSFARWDGAAWYPVASRPFTSSIAMLAWNDLLWIIDSSGRVYCGNMTSPLQELGRPLSDTSALAALEDRLVVVSESNTNTAPRTSAALYDGSAWDLLDVPNGPSGPVEALAEYQRSLFAGGAFGSTTGTPSGIARWDGAAWHPLDEGVTNPAHVTALATHAGELVATGAFSLAGAGPTDAIAAWNGTFWRALAGGLGTGGPIGYALANFDDDLYVTGAFTGPPGQPYNSIARWDGTAWRPLGTGLSAPAAGFALAEFDGALIVGGAFSAAGGLPIHALARWDGESWTPVSTPGIQGGGRVYALRAVDGELYVGGAFATADGITVNNIARWDGAIWIPLDAGLNSHVQSLGVHDGALIAGGRFTATADGLVSLDHIARWDGAAWTPLEIGLDGEVHTLLSHQGALFAGGTFQTAGSIPSPFIARRAAQFAPPTIITQPVSAGMQVGADSVLAVEATPADLDFQWQKFDGTAWHNVVDGPRITGAATATLTIQHFTIAAAGDYRVVAGNVCGQLASDTASLTLCPAAPGDINCDDAINFFDVDPFVTILLDGPGPTACGGFSCGADTDCSGTINFFDIDPFVACLMGACAGCP